MVVLTENNYVILGPMIYKKIRFENVLLEEHELQVDLPSTIDSEFIINETFKLYPVVDAGHPPYNPHIQHLIGPYYEFTPQNAIMTHGVDYLPLDFCKQRLKETIAGIRYDKENEGTKATVQGTQVTLDTNRNNRSNIIQSYLLLGDNDTINWKFPEGWFTLTKQEFGDCIAAAHQYIQDQFAWEATKIAEIDACTSHEELLNGVIDQITPKIN